MPQTNENHLHDLGKYIFGFSVFWTYLWFSQFMLIWYGNIPEETAWFLERKREYNFLFGANLAVNFLVPFLVLMRRDAKRNFTCVDRSSIIADRVPLGRFLPDDHSIYRSWRCSNWLL